MILADTSVLIGYLQGASGAPFAALNELIDQSVPVGINKHIYQEVLQGVKTEKELRRLQEYLDTLPFYELLCGRESYGQAAKLYFRCRKAGITVKSAIAFLIAQTAIENNLYLLHNDLDFRHIARAVKELKLYK